MLLIRPGKTLLAVVLSIPIVLSTAAYAESSNGNASGNNRTGQVGRSGNSNSGGDGGGNVGSGNSDGSSLSQGNIDAKGGNAPSAVPPGQSFATAPPDSPLGKLKTYYTAEVAAFAADAALKKAKLAVRAANNDLLTAQAMSKHRPFDLALAQATIASNNTLAQATAALNAARSNAAIAHTLADTKLAAAISRHFSPNARAWLDTKLTVMFHTK